MNLQMKAIKHSEWASEETFCYQANVYLDGKPFALVSNDGHGGADRVEFHDKSPFVQREASSDPELSFQFNCKEWWKKLKEIELYFESLPNTDVGKYDFAPEGFGQTFESWCHEQVTEYLILKDFREAIKKRRLAKMTVDGKTSIYEFKLGASSQAIKQRYPDAIILNDLPIDQGLSLFKENT